MTLSVFLEKIFPLRPKDERKEGFIKATLFYPSLDLNNDSAYFYLLLYKSTFMAGIILFIVVFIDLFNFNYITDFFKYQKEKTYLAVIFYEYFQWLVLAFTIGFYIRFRLVIDLKSEPIFFMFNTRLVNGKPRSKWIRSCLVLAFVFIMFSTFGYLFVTQLSSYLHVQQNLFFVSLFTIFSLLGSAGSPMILFSVLLISEKSYRFLPAMQQDLTQQLGE